MQSKWKNQWKTISTEEKLDLKNQVEKSKWIVDVCCNVWLTHSSVCTVCVNADGIKQITKSGTQVFVSIARLSQSYQNELHQKLWMCISYICIALEINKYIVQKFCIEMCVIQSMHILTHRIGLYVHQWYSRILYGVRLSFPFRPGNTLF